MIYKVTLNGTIYEVEVEKGDAVMLAEYAAALPTAAPAATAVPASAPAAVASAPAAPVSAAAAPSAGAYVIDSPLPGNINAVKVTTGQAVKKGDLLFLLEAMKMENEIVADRDGKIGQIFVQKGVTVETGAPLVEII